MNFSVVEGFLVILLIALVVTVIFRYLRIPIILGYVLVGVLVGPHVLGWLPDTKVIKELAEFGVVLLMFTIGLEFSLSKLFALRYAVFVLGGLQVLFSIIVTVIVGISLGMSAIASIVVGGVVAMSSTAIVIKQLSEQSELNTQHGSNAIGILLFQDLAVIPLLVFIASMTGTSDQSFWITLLWSFVKGIIAIAVILVFGRWLLRPLFRLIAATRIVELFTLGVLFVAVGTAWVTNVLGVSYALGAFLAGIMLAECEYRHQIKVEIRPFRDVLLGLFFISVGMLVNIAAWPQTWIWIVLLVMGLMIGKALLIILFNLLSKYDLVTATRTGLILSQGGEFGFAILTLALVNQLLPMDWGQSILAALLISFIFAPIIIRYNEKITLFLLPKKLKQHAVHVQLEVAEVAHALKNHVIICGYGRVGQNIARFLEKVNCSYIGLDVDPEIVQNAKVAGDPVTYGDATHPEILEAAKLSEGKAVLISFGDIHPTINALNQIRSTYPKIPILVRSRDEAERKLLQQHGATKIVTETFEESLTLAHHLLKAIEIPQHQISKLLQDVRDKNYDVLYKIFPGSFVGEETEKDVLHEYLRPIPLSEKAHAVGHTLHELTVQKTGVDVVALRRGQSRHLKPKGDIKLHVGDILILYGSPEQLDEAEKILLEGF